MGQVNGAEEEDFTSGLVVTAIGSVVDVSIPTGVLPPINHALQVAWSGPHRLIVDVVPGSESILSSIVGGLG